jgi:hypothetical protein
LADIERRGSSPSSISLAAASNAGIDTESAANATPRKRSLLAAIFGSAADDAEEAKPPATPAPVRVAAAPAAPALPVPLPKMRPAGAPVVVAVALPPARMVPDSPKQIALAASPSPTPSDIINARGYWIGVPDMGRLAATATRQKADPATTASIPPEMRTPAETSMQRLAYAALPERHAPAKASRRTVVTKSPATATTVAVKASAPTATAMPVFDPWLDAVIMAPSVWTYLSATQYGVRDFRALQPYLDKPAATVAMAFSNDPHQGLDATRFSGRAIVFLRTLTFAAASDSPGRTVSLR